MDPFTIKSDKFDTFAFEQVGFITTGPGVNLEFWAAEAREKGQKVLVTPQGLEFYAEKKKK